MAAFMANALGHLDAFIRPAVGAVITAALLIIFPLAYDSHYIPRIRRTLPAPQRPVPGINVSLPKVFGVPNTIQFTGIAPARLEPRQHILSDETVYSLLNETVEQLILPGNGGGFFESPIYLCLFALAIIGSLFLFVWCLWSCFKPKNTVELPANLTTSPTPTSSESEAEKTLQDLTKQLEAETTARKKAEAAEQDAKDSEAEFSRALTKTAADLKEAKNNNTAKATALEDLRTQQADDIHRLTSGHVLELTRLKTAKDTEIERLTGEQSSKDTEIQRLKDEKTAQDSEIERLTRFETEKDAEIKRLIGEQTSKDSEIERLQKDKTAQESEIERFKKEKTDQDSELQRVTGEQSAKDSEIERLNKAKNAQDSEIERLISEQSTKDSEIERLKKDKARQDAEVEQLKKEAEAKEAKNDEIAGLKTDKSDLEEQKTKLEEQVAELEKKEKDASEAFQVEKQKVTELSEQKSAWTDNSKEVKKTAEELAKVYQQKFDLEEQKTKLEEHVAELEKKENDASEALRAEKKKVTDLSEEKVAWTNHSNEVKRTSEELAKVHQQKVDLEQKLTGLDEEKEDIERLKETNDNLADDLNKVTTDRDDLQKRIDILTREQETLAKEKEDAESSVQKFAEADKQAELQKLEASKKLEQERDNLKNAVSGFEGRLKAANEQQAKDKEIIAKLESDKDSMDLDDNVEDIGRLKAEHKEALDHLQAEYEQALDRLRSDKESAEKELNKVRDEQIHETPMDLDEDVEDVTRLNSEHEQALERLRNQKDTELSNQKNQMEKDHQQELAAAKQEVENHQVRNNKLLEDIEQLKKQAQHGQPATELPKKDTPLFDFGKFKTQGRSQAAGPGSAGPYPMRLGRKYNPDPPKNAPTAPKAQIEGLQKALEEEKEEEQRKNMDDARVKAGSSRLQGMGQSKHAEASKAVPTSIDSSSGGTSQSPPQADATPKTLQYGTSKVWTNPSNPNYRSPHAPGGANDPSSGSTTQSPPQTDATPKTLQYGTSIVWKNPSNPNYRSPHAPGGANDPSSGVNTQSPPQIDAIPKYAPGQGSMLMLSGTYISLHAPGGANNFGPGTRKSVQGAPQPNDGMSGPPHAYSSGSYSSFVANPSPTGRPLSTSNTPWTRAAPPSTGSSTIPQRTGGQRESPVKPDWRLGLDHRTMQADLEKAYAGLKKANLTAGLKKANITDGGSATNSEGTSQAKDTNPAKDTSPAKDTNQAEDTSPAKDTNQAEDTNQREDGPLKFVPPPPGSETPDPPNKRRGGLGASRWNTPSSDSTIYVESPASETGDTTSPSVNAILRNHNQNRKIKQPGSNRPTRNNKKNKPKGA
ncbi:hypothetical protein K491DRAFT_712828 [Lophiostoma macrostomum CBS 122681]|uniref:Uncharacterized protein n=1 Tax=Lophiostoma macrostomum CBS 122681 TaxID=1314788 RepID=A0A6A6THD0_9PLEO|nr:hypothetical protein K491DRAFT_712828 [Lophiostoma macrostomum CBS 122681]